MFAICGWGLLGGRRPSRGELIGMALGLSGVLLLMRGGSFVASPASVACILAATAGWSLGSVLSTTHFALAPGASGFASESYAAARCSWWRPSRFGERPQWPPQPAAAAAWLYLVVLGSLVAFSPICTCWRTPAHRRLPAMRS